MGLFQPMHLLVIAVVALVVFGPQRLPGLVRSLARGIKEIRKALREITESEPVAMAREVRQTVNDFKQSLNPLTLLSPPRGTTPITSAPAAPAAAPAEVKAVGGTAATGTETKPETGAPPQS